MCGIFGFVGRHSESSSLVVESLRCLEYRGYDSWGIAMLLGSRIITDKHVGKIGKAQVALRESHLALGHTRWATHGGVYDKNAHPHIDCTKTLALVHNGIVENHASLKKDLIHLGHRFKSGTDSEITVHLVEEELEKRISFREAVFRAFRKLKGSNAIGIFNSQNGELLACRNGSPLIVGVGDGINFLASDATAFLDKTKKAVYLQDGEGIVLTKDTPELYDISSGKKKKLRVEKISWEPQSIKLGNFPHFLIKEVYEQAETIPRTVLLNEQAKTELADRIRAGAHVVLVGCGTAAHCAHVGKYLFARAGISADSFGAYEFPPFAGGFGKNTIAIFISQSGETADTLIAARLAQKRGAHIVAVVNARGSTLERMADTILAVGSGPEIAVVSTKAFSAQVATLYSLVQEVMRKKVIMPSRKEFSVLIETLDKKMRKVAERLAHQEHMFLIGKYDEYVAACECALKIKETSYIHAEAFSSAELKHGVITLIADGTPCIVLANDHETFSEVCASAAEIKARGGYIIGFSNTDAPEFDELVLLPEFPRGLITLPSVIAAQLLAYHLGVLRGADPDKPRNLAKSVTVK